MLPIDVFGICTSGARVRAGGRSRAQHPPRSSDRSYFPVTAPLNTAKLYIGKRFFISTCHNKVDDVRYRSRLVMCCLVGGFFYGGNNDDKALGSAKLMLAKLGRVS